MTERTETFHLALRLDDDPDWKAAELDLEVTVEDEDDSIYILDIRLKDNRWMLDQSGVWLLEHWGFNNYLYERLYERRDSERAAAREHEYERRRDSYDPATL